MKPLAFFTIADNNNLPYAQMMMNSLKKFHPDIPIILIGEEQIKKYNDPHFFYRATPIVASELLEEYECVVKLDADQIITGDLSHIWEGDFDVAVVQNANPKETEAYPVTVWNIPHQAYINCGFVVMKSKPFVKHWRKLCHTPHFDAYQFKEQDLLNIMIYYGDYVIKHLDMSDKWHGLISKGYWANIELQPQTQDGLGSNPFPESRDSLRLILPKGVWPVDGDKQIVCLHYAGGNVQKWHDINTRFTPEVAKYIKELIK